MISRNERGKLELRTLDLQVFLDDLFDICKTEREIEWLLENIQGYAEGCAEDKMDDLGIENNEYDEENE